MLVVIYKVQGPRHATLPVAGKPLIVRQLQWIRAQGVRRVAVEVEGADQKRELSSLLSAVAVGLELELVENGDGFWRSTRELATAGGCPERERFLALPADTLGNVSLAEVPARCGRGGVVIRAGDSDVPPPHGQLRVIDGADQPMRVVEMPGWLVQVGNIRHCHDLTMSILAGRLQGEGDKVLIHAAEVSPGVWVSRRADVHPSATLVPPVLIGSGAIVQAKAVVGPRSVLGRGSVVTRGSRVISSRVLPDTIVGEGIRLESVLAGPDGVTDLDTQTTTRVDDPLVLTKRPRRGRAVA